MGVANVASVHDAVALVLVLVPPVAPSLRRRLRAGAFLSKEV